MSIIILRVDMLARLDHKTIWFKDSADARVVCEFLIENAKTLSELENHKKEEKASSEETIIRLLRVVG